MYVYKKKKKNLKSLAPECDLNELFILPLQDTLEICGNRHVLFDNKTEDQVKKDLQLRNLISQVNLVVEKNSGKPYIRVLYMELKVSYQMLCFKYIDSKD